MRALLMVFFVELIAKCWSRSVNQSRYQKSFEVSLRFTLEKVAIWGMNVVETSLQHEDAVGLGKNKIPTIPI